MGVPVPDLSAFLVAKGGVSAYLGALAIDIWLN